jgi:RNA polymerase sigma factor (sigma-70 family)
MSLRPGPGLVPGPYPGPGRFVMLMTGRGPVTGMVTVDEGDWLAERFEAHRPHLRAVAYRMLGSPSEADDAVQDAWLRLHHADPGAVGNLGGWLTTVVARICLDRLRTRGTRREQPLDPLDALAADPAVALREATDPEEQAIIVEGVGLALLVVLDTLTPAERVAFVLHDMFDVPFQELAPIVGRSPAAAKMLASRARRRVQGAAGDAGQDPAHARQRQRQRAVVDAFLSAARGGDLARLVALLDPEVVLRADQVAVGMGAAGEVRGAAAVAEAFSGRARVAQPALVDGAAGAVWAPGGRPRVVFAFTITDGRIAAIDLLADPDRLHRLDLTVLGD